jgi:hypothetical protein
MVNYTRQLRNETYLLDKAGQLPIAGSVPSGATIFYLQHIKLSTVFKIRIRDPVFLTPWIRNEFFPHLGSFWLWLKQEKAKFSFHFSCKIRDEKMVGFGSGIKHYESATLVVHKLNLSPLGPLLVCCFVLQFLNIVWLTSFLNFNYNL